MPLDLEISPAMQFGRLNDIARTIESVSLETRESFPERVCTFDRIDNRIEIAFENERITFDSSKVSRLELDPLASGPHLLYSIVLEFVAVGTRVGAYMLMVGSPSSLRGCKTP